MELHRVCARAAIRRAYAEKSSLRHGYQRATRHVTRVCAMRSWPDSQCPQRSVPAAQAITASSDAARPHARCAHNCGARHATRGSDGDLNRTIARRADRGASKAQLPNMTAHSLAKHALARPSNIDAPAIAAASVSPSEIRPAVPQPPRRYAAAKSSAPPISAS